jgi:hypothetical protein
MQALLEALEADDEDPRRALAAQHASQVRRHITQLAAKWYQDRMPTTPDAVVLLLPAEAFYALALQQDPGLLEYALSNRVLLATPTTLMALLTSVAFTWRQDGANRHALDVLQSARVLHERLTTFLSHLAKIGVRLNSAVDAYNKPSRRFRAVSCPAPRGSRPTGPRSPSRPPTRAPLSSTNRRPRDPAPSGPTAQLERLRQQIARHLLALAAEADALSIDNDAYIMASLNAERLAEGLLQLTAYGKLSLEELARLLGAERAAGRRRQHDAIRRMLDTANQHRLTPVANNNLDISALTRC